jgi:hypothetical protein
MIRTVVHRVPKLAETKGAADGAPASPSPKEAPQDQFGDKLVKYIPAEVIAFFLPAYALVEPFRKDGHLEDLQWLPYVLVVAGFFGVMGYLFIRAPKENPPRPYFYILAGLAFLAWAAGTSAASSDVFHLIKPEISGKLIVFAAIFLIPLIDEILTRRLSSSS